jgi:exopolysaccharide biosynthesis polyprenyl glycosylphosphotransferase
MSVLVSRLLTFRQELAIELQRFVLLWRYQHHVPPFTLWWRLVLKRVVDTLAAAAGIVLTAPVMAAVALAVKLDSKGPVLYAQERVGRFGEVFKMYKFRTMRVDAESNGPVWAAREGDPRVTRLGTLLRRTHLDELPQIFNVLKGDMSLVGPRPERPHFVEQLDREVPRYDERLLIKPGMTGLAQVHYRYDQTIEDVKKKLRFDLLYVKRMCLMLDARILAWTILVVITGRGIK